MSNVVYVLPEVVLALGVSALLVWGSVVSTDGSRRWPLVDGPMHVLSMWLVLLVLLVVLATPASLTSLSLMPASLMDRSLVTLLSSNGLTVTLKQLLLVAVLASLAASRSFARTTELYAYEYPLVMLLATLGRRLLVSARDRRRVYLALELQSLALYVLAAFRRGSAFSTEAALKYFMLGAVASGLYLLGASLVYGFLGTLSYESIGRLLLAPSFDGGDAVTLAPVVAGFVLTVIAFLFKRAVVPFHAWSPDVIEGSPLNSSRFFGAVSKIAVLAALMQLCYGPFYGLWVGAAIDNVFVVCAALSMTVAALSALSQRRWKRFVAYSAIGHSGFRLMGLASASLEGLSATLMYIRVYVLGSVGLWAALVGLRSVSMPWSSTSSPVTQSTPVVYLTDVGGRGYEWPAMSLVLTVSMFSMAGVPPRSGFLAKLGVLFSARSSGHVLLARVAIGASVVGAYYYLRVIKIVYFDGGREGVQWLPLDTMTAWVVSLSTYVTVWRMADPTLPRVLSQRRALALLA